MIDDGHSKSERNSSDETKGLSVSELANMLSLSGDVDEALRIESIICSKLDEENVSEISSLLISKNRYFNISGLRLLADCSGFGISSVYKYVDRLFERNDLILNRLCIGLIEEYNFFEYPARKRMAQFIEFLDVPIRIKVRVWLLFLNIDEIDIFLKDNGPFSDSIIKFLHLLLDFKARKIDTCEFLDKISVVDEVAFSEYTILSKQKFGPPYHIFHKGSEI